ncbi:hypothetical protein [Paraburkholderia saeva]|uniref:Uncharacterized protein n=1 Tax=Paraburkholderia saeva TaxID=2777537 RepID=A0A9N8S0V9_9BURK|nr:hypothetical protein [Paraburkholderia saeva]CAG4919274.1 hypothetical protein LMG31841_04861 [Paraburkholderia saeva]
MHNDAKHFTEHETSVVGGERPSETHDAGGLIQFLWNQTDASKSTDKELEWLSYTCDQTELMALNLRKTLSGVASLLAWEIDSKGMKSGAFQPHDLPELLYGAADMLKVIEEMTHIGIDANFELRERYRKRAEQNGGER